MIDKTPPPCGDDWRDADGFLHLGDGDLSMPSVRDGGRWSVSGDLTLPRGEPFTMTLHMTEFRGEVPCTIKYPRSWRARLCSWPWRPWKRHDEAHGTLRMGELGEDGEQSYVFTPDTR